MDLMISEGDISFVDGLKEILSIRHLENHFSIILISDKTFETVPVSGNSLGSAL